MDIDLDRKDIFPEPELPDVGELIAESRRLAETVQVGSCAFLEEFGVESELAYKRRCVEDGRIMFHAHIGYRDWDKTRRACAEIHENLAAAKYRVDRFGLCFDRNMGYPADIRKKMPRGTGLILDGPEEFAELTRVVPVAPHFGDHMIGPPASLENTVMALAAGSTSLGNLSQYYSFDLLYEEDDIPRTVATVKAIALCAAQPVDVIVHSNIEDSFAPLFTDVCCCLGMVLVEQHIVNELLGATLAHCYGHTFSDPFNRLAFQRALRRVEPDTGSMIYGNTVSYGPDEAQNYAVLAGYMTVDILAQRLGPTPHALTPVPVTEFSRIPDVDEITAVHLFANRLIERTAGVTPLFELDAVDAVADRLIEGGERFRDNLMTGFREAAIDTENPLEMMLAIRRLGGKRLETLFGPGKPDARHVRGRSPVVQATTIAELERKGAAFLDTLEPTTRETIRARGLIACVATTDVHEWGKILVEEVLQGLGVEILDGGVNADPDDLAMRARHGGADLIALSTFNGIALTYMETLHRELGDIAPDLPVFIGGRLNQVPEGSNTSLPVDVTAKLQEAGARTCRNLDDLVAGLMELSARGPVINTIGIIGVGHFGGYLVEGFCREPGAPGLVLSPRGAARVQGLAARYEVTVAPDNQEVVEAADLVILTLRPKDMVSVARELEWRPGQRALTMAAGVSRAALAEAVAPADIVRAMASSNAVLGESPSILYPDDPEVGAVLARLGPLYVMPDEPTLEVASVVHIYYAWVFGVMETAARWGADNGVEPQVAREIAAWNTRGAAGMVLHQGDESLADIVTSLAPPGGTSERGFSVLAETDALGAWACAMDAVLRKVRGQEP